MLRASMIAALTGVLLLACESGTAPEAPDSGAAPPAFAAKPNPSFQPFAFTVDNCVESVALSGTFHEVFQAFVGPGGKQHFRFHINAKGTGIGQLTGARYQWNDRLFDVTNVAPVGTVSFTLNDRARLIGQGGAPNFTFGTQIKVTVNANGVVTVDRLVARNTCR